MERWTTSVTIAEARCIGIVRADSAELAAAAGQALVAGGITIVEIAYTTPDASAAITALRTACPEATVGAGTVLDAAAAFDAVRAGATFIVSPLVAEDVLRTGHRYGVAVIPGACTPTEINAAMELGADAVKLFPAAQLGVAYLRAIATAMPQVPFIPTGGVTAENAQEWLQAGAVAVGVGGDLTRGGPALIQARAHRLSTLLRQQAAPPA